MHKLQTKRAGPRDALLQVANLARVPPNECEGFCDDLRTTISFINKLHRRTASSKGTERLTRAANAARDLNDAVCSLSSTERKWIEKIALGHPAFSEDVRIRASSRPFELDELQQTTWLLAGLFGFSINRAFPVMPGLSDKKPGIGRNLAFEYLLRRLVVTTREARGKLPYNKNDRTGALVAAFDILRPMLPEGVIPKAPTAWVVQAIKTEHAKSRS